MLTVSKLSKLQKAILTALKDSDEFAGECISHLSHEIAKKTENQRDENIIYEDRRRQLIYQKVMKGEKRVDSGCFAMDRIQGDLLTPKFRAAFSRSLKRLEKRGLITKILRIKWEWGAGWKLYPAFRYLGDGRARRICLTEAGKKYVEV